MSPNMDPPLSVVFCLDVMQLLPSTLRSRSTGDSAARETKLGQGTCLAGGLPLESSPRLRSVPVCWSRVICRSKRHVCCSKK